MANEVAKQVICLPIYPDLQESEVERIVEKVHGAKGKTENWKIQTNK
ncbi:MAG: hypothetical protein ACOCP4_07105 [Candidatus Woesearchaeota archaeon]